MTAFDLRVRVEDLALKVKLAREAIEIQTEDMVNSNDMDRRDALGYTVDVIMADIQARADALNKDIESISITAEQKDETEDYQNM